MSDEEEILPAQSEDIEAGLPDYEVVGGEGEENSFQDKLKKLQDELRRCKKERDEYLAGWQRAKADFINARRDEEKRLGELGKMVEAGTILDFLAAIDSLEMLFKNTKDKNVSIVCAQFQEILCRHGVMPIECVGQKFDPALHEALGEDEVEDQKEDGIVLEELQKGYKLQDKVLRASKVKVGNYQSLK